MIDMRKYIHDCIQGFLEEEPDEKLRQVNTPATNNLFEIRDSGKMDKDFYSTVAKLLFVAKRAHPDILLTVSFLTTRVSNPDNDDWKKLVRLPAYLKNTGELLLILSWIAVDDALPTVQWTKNFMTEQGYDLETLIKEDNRSTMLLMKNGKLSSGKHTKHIDARYVKDLIDRGVVEIDHCVTEDTIADFLTKPLQGKRFLRMREIILNSTPSVDHREYVGKQFPRIMLN